MRNSQSQQQIVVPGSEEATTDASGKPALKRRPTIIIRPKESKPYLMVKTTRAKEEEKQRSHLESVLHPQTKSQPLLKYHRSFKSVVVPAAVNKSADSAESGHDSSLDRSEVSMYNTENLSVKHIYTTKSLITDRYKNSPYLKTPLSGKKPQLDKPWRMHNNGNFVEQHEQNKFLNNLQRDVTMNTNHIQSLKRKVGVSASKRQSP